MTTPERPVFPPGVLEALKKGNKLEAIKLMRQAAKNGVVDGKAMVEALQKVKGAVADARTPAQSPPSIRAHHSAPALHLPRSRTGLSPGEEPRTGGGFGWLFVILAAVVAAIWLVN